MLILSLIDNQHNKTIQRWQFELESLVRIGRANDNEVVINNDLISRYHLELHQIRSQQWELISKGANGTFFKGELIERLMLSNGAEVQLAKGGIWLKFDLLYTTQTFQTSPTIKPPNPEVITSDSVVSEPETENLKRILTGLNNQFSQSYLSERREEINNRLNVIKNLQIKSKEAINLAEENQQYPEILLHALIANHQDLELQKKFLEELQTSIKNAQQILDEFQKHWQANKEVSEKLPERETRIQQLLATVKEKLEELDRELGRIHTEHLLDSAKRIFLL